MYFMIEVIWCNSKTINVFYDDGCGDLVCNNKTINVFDDDACGDLVCNNKTINVVLMMIWWLMVVVI